MPLTALVRQLQQATLTSEVLERSKRPQRLRLSGAGRPARALVSSALAGAADAPLVVVGPNTYDPNGGVGAGVEAHPEEGWAFNLYNNAWATNFPAFSIDANQRFRFSLRLR